MIIRVGLLIAAVVVLAQSAWAADCDYPPFRYTYGGAPTHVKMTVRNGALCSVSLDTPVQKAQIYDSPSNGTVTIKPDANGQYEGWSYQPNPGFTGPDNFTIELPWVLPGQGSARISFDVSAVGTATSRSAAPDEPQLSNIMNEIFTVVSPATIRERPDPLSNVVGSLAVGQKVNVLARVLGTRWYLIGDNDKPTGYVITDYLLADLQAQQMKSQQLLSSSSAQNEPPVDVSSLDFGRYVALVIGNNTYHYGIPVLKTAVNDAKAVAQSLKVNYGFKVTLLLNATRAQILQSLTQLRLTLTWDDNLLIYYAGHGSFDEGIGQGYWLPVDAVPQDPTNWVSNTDVTNMLKAIQARHILVVADSCYSGSLSREANTNIRDTQYLERIVQKRARTVLTSGGLEPVTDSGVDGHSIFADAFLAALQSNSSIMDAETFFERVRKPVILAGSQTPEYTNLQAAGHDGGDFVFVRKQ